MIHAGLRPYRTHATYTQRCMCGWEGAPVPHGEKSQQLIDHVSQATEDDSDHALV
jgi:hypothetical protein